MGATLPCHGDSFPLALTDVYPLVFRDKGQHLQDDVAEERAHQVFPFPRIQERHIQNHDVDLLFHRQESPLLDDVPIVPPQPVDALDVQQVARPQLLRQAQVHFPVEVLAGDFVEKNVGLVDAHFPQRKNLPILLLLHGADPCIPVNNAFHR